MSMKIDESELMSYEDFMELPLKEREQVKGRSVIVELERQKNNEKIQVAKGIRVEIVEFATDEILPLIEIKTKTVEISKKFDTDEKVKIENARLLEVAKAQANEKAFIIALKFFMMYDIRLQGHQTLEVVGAIMNITKERVRQVEDKSLKILRHPKISRQFRHYLNDEVSSQSSGF